MKFTFMRRGVAAIAAASLITIGAPVVTAANAADACALGATCEGALSGPLGDSPYTIQMPEKFNGTVLLYSHGYRIGTPLPAALATRWALIPVLTSRSATQHLLQPLAAMLPTWHPMKLPSHQTQPSQRICWLRAMPLLAQVMPDRGGHPLKVLRQVKT